MVVYVRKKKIKGREYYYAVISTREDAQVKKKEHYIGTNKPSEEDLKDLASEFDSTKRYLDSIKKELAEIKHAYRKKIENATSDELNRLEDEAAVRFTYDTSRIEGSSLSYKDTKLLLNEGITPGDKPIKDVKEIQNHKEAHHYMKENLKKNIDVRFMLRLHAILKKDVTEDAGSFRNGQVLVGDMVPVKPSMIEPEINNLIAWYAENKAMNPLEMAAVFHSIFERVHPFFDGNGRVGRLLLNHILLRKGYPLLIIQNKNRRRYYNALRRADDGNYLYMVKYLFYELKQSVKRYT